jgi:hypothetical protein
MREVISWTHAHSSAARESEVSAVLSGEGGRSCGRAQAVVFSAPGEVSVERKEMAVKARVQATWRLEGEEI